MAMFEGHGLSFRYPEEWDFSESSDDDGTLTLHVQSPQTAFWSLTISEGTHPAAEVFDAVAAALRSEYESIDMHLGGEEATISGVPPESATIEFVCHELPVLAEAHVLHLRDQTFLVLTQYADAESEESETLLSRMTASLTIANG